MYISLKQTFEGFKEVNEALKGTDDTMAQMKKRTKKINNSPQSTICRQKTKIEQCEIHKKTPVRNRSYPEC